MTRPSVAHCIGAAADAFGLPYQCLYARDRRAKIARVRYAAMLLAHQAGHNRTLIGRVLHMNYGSVTNGIGRAETLRAADPDFQRRYLKAALLASAPPTASAA